MSPVSMGIGQKSQWPSCGVDGVCPSDQQPFILPLEKEKPQLRQGEKSSVCAIGNGSDNQNENRPLRNVKNKRLHVPAKELPEDDELDDDTYHMCQVMPMDDDIDSPDSAHPVRKIQPMSDILLMSPGFAPLPFESNTSQQSRHGRRSARAVRTTGGNSISGSAHSRHSKPVGSSGNTANAGSAHSRRSTRSKVSNNNNDANSSAHSRHSKHGNKSVSNRQVYPSLGEGSSRHGPSTPRSKFDDTSSRRLRRTARKGPSSRVMGISKKEQNANIESIKTPTFSNSDEAAAHWARMSMAVAPSTPAVDGETENGTLSAHRDNFVSPDVAFAANEIASKSRAEQQRQRMHGAKAAKKDRKKEIKNSLASFLNGNSDDESAPIDETQDNQRTENDEADEDDEDDSMISEEDPTEPKPVLNKPPSRRSLLSSKSFSAHDGDDASARSDGRRRKMRRSKSGDEHSLSSMWRKGSDAKSVSSTSRRGGRRRRISDTSSEDLQKPRRVQGEPQKRLDTRRKPSTDALNTSKSSLFSSVSNNSVSRRRRGDSSSSMEKEKDTNDNSTQKDFREQTGKVGKGSSRKRDPADDEDITATESSEASLSRSRRQLSSLSDHLQKTSMSSIPQDIEEVSEESSRLSFGYQSTLLQFDPTNASNVTAVRQDRSQMTSETIKYSDGTEHELQIHNVDGLLPTFETPKGFVDSLKAIDAQKLASEKQSKAPTTNSPHFYGPSPSPLPAPEPDLFVELDRPRPPPTKSIRRHKSGDLIGMSTTDKPPELKRNKSGGLMRGVSVSKSFLRRVRKGEDANDQGVDEDDKKKSSKLFSRLKNKSNSLAHQALSDEGDLDDNFDDTDGLLN